RLDLTMFILPARYDCVPHVPLSSPPTDGSKLRVKGQPSMSSSGRKRTFCDATVKSRHVHRKKRCPLHPQKRTSHFVFDKIQIVLSGPVRCRTSDLRFNKPKVER